MVKGSGTGRKNHRGGNFCRPFGISRGELVRRGKCSTKYSSMFGLFVANVGVFGKHDLS